MGLHCWRPELGVHIYFCDWCIVHDVMFVVNWLCRCDYHKIKILLFFCQLIVYLNKDNISLLILTKTSLGLSHLEKSVVQIGQTGWSLSVLILRRKHFSWIQQEVEHFNFNMNISFCSQQRGFTKPIFSFANLCTTAADHSSLWQSTRTYIRKQWSKIHKANDEPKETPSIRHRTCATHQMGEANHPTEHRN